MNILALDTALGACSAAIARGLGDSPEIFSAFELRTREHAESIVPMIARVLAEAGLGFDVLDAIAVTSGPGTFTGVRVGVATARGLALATGLPLISANTLEVMAHMALEKMDSTPGCLGVVVDARRGEVYLALFDRSGKSILEPVAVTPGQAAAALEKQDRPVLVGGGSGIVAEAAAEKGLSLETGLVELQPDAATLARMALTRPPLEGPLHPLYLRPPDAKPQTGKALPRRD